MNNNERKLQLPSNPRYSKSPSPGLNRGKDSRAQNNEKKISVVGEMEKMKQRREDRRKRKEDDKRNKIEMMNNPDYIPRLDLDYENMISNKKSMIEKQISEPHTTSDTAKLFVCVRKRPIFQKELLNGEIDCISALNPKMCVYECKMKIDGITKYIDCNEFYFDNVFNEYEDTESLYKCSIEPTIDLLLQGGVVTCFAYGQTGSGKTYTMKGIQDQSIDSLFASFSQLKKGHFSFYLSFFEIYSGRLYDLLNNRNKVMALEDKNQKVQIFGLEEKEVKSPQEMKDVVEFANTMRTTHNTVTNETSSRSHAICNFTIKEKGNEDDQYAKLTLVDLAGSERATETLSNNKSRLAEGAEINKSLLALKECIRALDARKIAGNQEHHVPFRTSKLTLVLRDSFISKSNISKIIMISCVSPGYSSANHTINTLRYSDRLKEKTSQMAKKNASIFDNNNQPQLQPQQHQHHHVNLLHSDQLNNVMQINLSSNNDNSNNNNNNHHHHQQQPNKIKNTNVTNNNNNGKSNNITKQRVNNFINEDPEIEDNLQKLILNPTPISKPNILPHKAGFKIKKSSTVTQSSANSNSKSSRANHQLNNKLHDLDYLKISYEDQAQPQYNGVEKELNDQINIYTEEENLSTDLLEEQDYLISSHMNVIKDEAKLLTEEGELISNIKGVTEENYPMEEYALKLDAIIKKKLQHYIELKKKIEYYKNIEKEAN